MSEEFRLDWEKRGVGRGSALGRKRGREWVIVNHTDWHWNCFKGNASLRRGGAHGASFLILILFFTTPWKHLEVSPKHFCVCALDVCDSEWLSLLFLWIYPLTWLQRCRFSCYMAGAVSNWTHLDLNWTEPSDVLSVLFFTLKCSKNNNKQASCWGIIII